MKEQNPKSEDEHVWEDGWNGHELEQMRRLAKLSFPEKLQWLEDAHRMVMRMQEQQQAKKDQPPKS
jgi:hypothetical protein